MDVGGVFFAAVLRLFGVPRGILGADFEADSAIAALISAGIGGAPMQHDWNYQTMIGGSKP